VERRTSVPSFSAREKDSNSYNIDNVDYEYNRKLQRTSVPLEEVQTIYAFSIELHSPLFFFQTIAEHIKLYF